MKLFELCPVCQKPLSYYDRQYSATIEKACHTPAAYNTIYYNHFTQFFIINETIFTALITNDFYIEIDYTRNITTFSKNNENMRTYHFDIKFNDFNHLINKINTYLIFS